MTADDWRLVDKNVETKQKYAHEWNFEIFV